MFDKNGFYTGDIICQNNQKFINQNSLTKNITSINIDGENAKTFLKGKKAYSPMIPVMRKGIVNKVEMNRSLKEIKEYTQKNVQKLDPAHLRLKSPHKYVAGLEQSLFNTRRELRKKALLKTETQHER